jgi:hypothetical protein
MLHHVSFNADDPQGVAAILAGWLGASAVRAPTPPFPAGSRFVCAGDERGSYLEVLPLDAVFDPAAPSGLRRDERAAVHTGGHALVSTPHAADAILRRADSVGWQAEVARTPLFSVVKVWIENRTLLELLPSEWADDYLATFGNAGIAGLDAKLRGLESEAPGR